MATHLPTQDVQPAWRPPPSAQAQPERSMPRVAPAPLMPDQVYNDQFIEALVARLTPRLVYELRVQHSGPNRVFGYRLALAMVSMALLIPLIAIALGAAQQFNAGFFEWLIAVGVICFTVLLINVGFDLSKS